MSNHRKWFRWMGFALVAAVFAHSPAWAQPTAKPSPAPDTSKYKVLIGTGGAGGTYDVMVGQELMGKCKRGDIFGTVTQDGGTTANIDGVLANKLDAGVGQEDSLFLKKSNNPEVNGLKTLVALHPEEVHVFVRKDTGLRQPDVVKPKYMGMGEERTQGAPIVFSSVEDTVGQRVVTWGGSFDTARLVSANGGLNWNVNRVANQDAAFAELNAGKAQVVLAVSGAPAQNFEKLSNANLKLIGFKDQTVMKLTAIYNGGAKLNYSNLDAEGVNTISTNAVLFTREYSDPEMIAALAEFRECAWNAAKVLRDARGAHKKWKQVPTAKGGKWQWYDLPAVSTKKR